MEKGGIGMTYFTKFINSTAAAAIMTVAIAAAMWPSLFGYHQPKLPEKLAK